MNFLIWNKWACDLYIYITALLTMSIHVYEVEESTFKFQDFINK
jgi:hypothetical protein